MAEHIPNLAEEHDEMIRTYRLRRGTLTGTIVGIVLAIPYVLFVKTFDPVSVFMVMSTCGGWLGWMYVWGRT